MLIEFSVGNYRSFKDRVTLNLEATTDLWLEATHTFESETGVRLLRSVGVYGPNASGKSNLVRAMKTMRRLVLRSATAMQIGEKLEVIPFRLSTTTEKKPSHFEVVFLVGDIRYRYGFEADSERIQSEWLFRNQRSLRDTTLFLRDEEGIKIISQIFREGKGLESKTRPNALFLSVVAQFNGPIATEVLKWIDGFREISGLNDAEYFHYTAMELQENSKLRQRALRLAKNADFQIQGVLGKLESIKHQNFPKEIQEKLRDVFLNEENAMTPTIKTQHQKFDSKNRPSSLVEFDLVKDESEGTLKFISLSGPIDNVLDMGMVIAIDEFEARMHPRLSKALLRLFNSHANRNNAQLIFTTHDTGLIDPRGIRRDQVWFTEKDQYGATKLYTLSDIKGVRSNSKFAKEYLRGDYGAVPHVRPLEQAFTEIGN